MTKIQIIDCYNLNEICFRVREYTNKNIYIDCIVSLQCLQG